MTCVLNQHVRCSIKRTVTSIVKAPFSLVTVVTVHTCSCTGSFVMQISRASLHQLCELLLNASCSEAHQSRKRLRRKCDVIDTRHVESVINSCDSFQPMIAMLLLFIFRSESKFVAFQPSWVGKVWVWWVTRIIQKVTRLRRQLKKALSFISLSAVYLEKRFQKNKQKYALDEYELVERLAFHDLLKPSKSALRCHVFAGMSRRTSPVFRQHLGANCSASKRRNQVISKYIS